jgi:hypothetical protein
MIFNKYVLIGIGLIIVGFILSPIIIGIPIMILGFLVADFGILDWLIGFVPGLREKIIKFFKMIKDSYRPYFKRGGEINK